MSWPSSPSAEQVWATCLSLCTVFIDSPLGQLELHHVLCNCKTFRAYNACAHAYLVAHYLGILDLEGLCTAPLARAGSRAERTQAKRGDVVPIPPLVVEPYCPPCSNPAMPELASTPTFPSSTMAHNQTESGTSKKMHTRLPSRASQKRRRGKDKAGLEAEKPKEEQQLEEEEDVWSDQDQEVDADDGADDDDDYEDVAASGRCLLHHKDLHADDLEIEKRRSQREDAHANALYLARKGRALLLHEWDLKSCATNGSGISDTCMALGALHILNATVGRRKDLLLFDHTFLQGATVVPDFTTSTSDPVTWSECLRVDDLRVQQLKTLFCLRHSAQPHGTHWSLVVLTGFQDLGRNGVIL